MSETWALFESAFGDKGAKSAPSTQRAKQPPTSNINPLPPSIDTSDSDSDLLKSPKYNRIETSINDAWMNDLNERMNAISMKSEPSLPLRLSTTDMSESSLEEIKIEDMDDNESNISNNKPNLSKKSKSVKNQTKTTNKTTHSNLSTKSQSLRTKPSISSKTNFKKSKTKTAPLTTVTTKPKNNNTNTKNNKSSNKPKRPGRQKTAPPKRVSFHPVSNNTKNNNKNTKTTTPKTFSSYKAVYYQYAASQNNMDDIYNISNGGRNRSQTTSVTKSNKNNNKKKAKTPRASIKSFKTDSNNNNAQTGRARTESRVSGGYGAYGGYGYGARRSKTPKARRGSVKNVETFKEATKSSKKKMLKTSKTPKTKKTVSFGNNNKNNGKRSSGNGKLNNKFKNGLSSKSTKTMYARDDLASSKKGGLNRGRNSNKIDNDNNNNTWENGDIIYCEDAIGLFSLLTSYKRRFENGIDLNNACHVFSMAWELDTNKGGIQPSQVVTHFKRILPSKKMQRKLNKNTKNIITKKNSSKSKTNNNKPKLKTKGKNNSSGKTKQNNNSKKTGKNSNINISKNINNSNNIGQNKESVGMDKIDEKESKVPKLDMAEINAQDDSDEDNTPPTKPSLQTGRFTRSRTPVVTATARKRTFDFTNDNKNGAMNIVVNGDNNKNGKDNINNTNINQNGQNITISKPIVNNNNNIHHLQANNNINNNHAHEKTISRTEKWVFEIDKIFSVLDSVAEPDE